MKDKSIKLGEIHFNKSNYREFSDNCLPGIIQRAVKTILDVATHQAGATTQKFCRP